MLKHIWPFHLVSWLVKKYLSFIDINERSFFVVVVDWLCLTSHSAIFQLYSDGTDVKFPNFDLLPGTKRHGQLGSLVCGAYLDTGTRTSEDVFHLLAIRGPTDGEGKRGIEPGSSDPKSSPLHLRHRGGQRSFFLWKEKWLQKIKKWRNMVPWRNIVLCSMPNLYA